MLASFAQQNSKEDEIRTPQCLSHFQFFPWFNYLFPTSFNLA